MQLQLGLKICILWDSRSQTLMLKIHLLHCLVGNSVAVCINNNEFKEWQLSFRDVIFNSVMARCLAKLPSQTTRGKFFLCVCFDSTVMTLCINRTKWNVQSCNPGSTPRRWVQVPITVINRGTAYSQSAASLVQWCSKCRHHDSICLTVFWDVWPLCGLWHQKAVSLQTHRKDMGNISHWAMFTIIQIILVCILEG